ncbi:hypothetical protein M0812_17703 [Anaeramoeba flamelloides]|uniref:Disease resistance R13L4/SHOC-2-like LRR domain-containing protein n=1 Tax=Anaeramoeba flamelloides TaxID=1746091 RepID=A0AAV7ZBP6_9EUKA|nr:hypothetical protein M0812_17703 [Anaeramoeba flamelloides]
MGNKPKKQTNPLDEYDPFSEILSRSDLKEEFELNIIKKIKIKKLKQKQKHKKIETIIQGTRQGSKSFSNENVKEIEKNQSQIVELDFSWNYLVEIPLNFSEMKKLRKLKFHKNAMKIGKLQNIHHLKMLTFLDLSFNRITQLPKEIGKIENLEVFKLNNNRLDVMPNCLFKLKKLYSLNLSKNSITNTVQPISLMKSLAILDLSYNKMNTLKIDCFYDNNLTDLNLSHNLIQSLPKKMKDNSKLQFLDLSHNKLEEIPQILFSLRNLETLNLAFNTNLKGKEIPENISKLKKLKNFEYLGVDLSIEKPLPQSFSKLTNLQVLKLRYCGLTSLPQVLLKLKNLQVLDLTGNSLNDLPEQFETSFPKLSVICFAFNKFKKVPNGILDHPNSFQAITFDRNPFEDDHLKLLNLGNNAILLNINEKKKNGKKTINKESETETEIKKEEIEIENENENEKEKEKEKEKEIEIQNEKKKEKENEEENEKEKENENENEIEIEKEKEKEKEEEEEEEKEKEKKKENEEEKENENENEKEELKGIITATGMGKVSPNEKHLKKFRKKLTVKTSLKIKIKENSTTLNVEELKDKIKGCIIGNCLGDSMGLSTEFLNKNQNSVYYSYGVIYPSDFILDHHRSNWEQGDWTDDSDQMLLILDNLLDGKGKLDEIDYASRLLNWAKYGIADFGDLAGNGLGRTVNSVLHHECFLTEPHKSSFEVWERYGKRGAANGALMRTSILGIPNFDDLDQVVDNTLTICKITHYDPRCRASSIALTTAIALILQGESDLEQILETATKIGAKQFLIEENLEKEKIEEYSQDYIKYSKSNTWEDLKLDQSGQIGYTLKCFASAFVSLRKLGNSKDSSKVLRILSELVWEGGDSDTNGAIAGALLGTWVGFSNLPKEWIMEMPHLVWVEERVEMFFKLLGI